jgi:hypothetical protein
MVNVDPLAVGPEEDLRVQLTPEAADRVEREFGTVGTSLVGRLAPSGPDSLALDAWLGQIYSDASLSNARLVIPLQRTEVVEVQRRELSTRRTLLASLAGAGMVALILSRTSLFQAELGDDVDPGSPPTPTEDSAILRALRFTLSIPFHIAR